MIPATELTSIPGAAPAMRFADGSLGDRKLGQIDGLPVRPIDSDSLHDRWSQQQNRNDLGTIIGQQLQPPAARAIAFGERVSEKPLLGPALGGYKFVLDCLSPKSLPPSWGQRT